MACVAFPFCFNDLNILPSFDCWNACCGILAPFSLTRALLEPPESEWVTAKVNYFDPDGCMRYKCRQCEGMIHYQSYKQKLYLNYARLKFECGTCYRKYMTRRALKAHQQRHKEKTHVCSHCSKGFVTSVELRNHINTHTGEKPYRCPVCDVAFASSSKYYSHVRKLHRRYDCYSCFLEQQARQNSSPDNQQEQQQRKESEEPSTTTITTTSADNTNTVKNNECIARALP